MNDAPVSRRRALASLAGAVALGWAGRRLTTGPSLGLQQGPGSGPNPQSSVRNPQSPDSLLGRLMDPAAGGMEPPITQYENDPFVVGIEQKLRCTCGCNLSVYTCRTTDFTCSVSPKMHQQVVALVKQGKTAQQVIDAFVAQYGVAVLMAPPRRGFNLLGYLVPGSLILIVGTALTWVLVRRNRAAARSGDQVGVALPLAGAADRLAVGPAAAPQTLPPDAAAKLRAELDNLES